MLGIAILLVRRNVPESPRWLFIHGRENEAERIVDQIETGVRDETGLRARRAGRPDHRPPAQAISFRTIAATAFKLYP